MAFDYLKILFLINFFIYRKKGAPVTVFSKEVILHTVHEFAEDPLQFGSLMWTHSVQGEALEIRKVL